MRNQYLSELNLLNKMIYFIIFVVLIWIWIIYEFHSAPCLDKDDKLKKNDSTTKSNDTYREIF